MNLYKIIREKLVEDMQGSLTLFEETRPRLFSQQISKLNSMNLAAKNSVGKNDTEDVLSESYSCSYCGSKLFQKDRNCPQCGAPAHVSSLHNKNILQRTENKSGIRKFMVSVGNCFGYDRITGELLFDGKTLIDTGTQININGSLHLIYSNNDIKYNVCDLSWAGSDKQSIVKFIVESQVVEENATQNNIQIVKFTFPCFQLNSWGKSELVGQALAYHDNYYNADLCGFCQISQ